MILFFKSIKFFRDADRSKSTTDFDRLLRESEFYTIDASRSVFVHHEINTYFRVYERRELISPKLNRFQSASVNSEIIILSCNPFCADTEKARTGTINALHRT